MMGESQMYRCPACNAEVEPTRQYCDCGADLALLVEMNDLTSAWYNQAIEEARGGRPGRALELIGACCVAQPEDPQFRYVHAQVLGQLGLAEQGLEALAQCERANPDYPGIDRLRLALKQQKARQDARGPDRSCSSRHKSSGKARIHYGQNSRH